MKPDQTTFTRTMSRVRLETLGAAHDGLTERTRAKEGQVGVTRLRSRTYDALHTRMAAELFQNKARRDG